jgi:hypothetical protein
VTAEPLCDCGAAPIPHRHPTAKDFEAMRKGASQAPAEDRVPLGVAVLPPFTDEQLPDTMPPRPPAAIPAVRHPLSLHQAGRRDALRASLEFYREISGEDYDDIDVIETAHRFSEFIRADKVPLREKEA